ncbi:MAG: diguanylate cyclase [Rhodospirillales bacterium]|nr:diguanylate cyclase [Rhodospirillales bacterium]
MIDAMETQRGKILIVGEYTDIFNIIEVLFGETHVILTARSGKHGLAMVIEETPDLILLDVKLPDMDGYQVCSWLKSAAETENIPVIFLTAESGAKEELAGLNMGAIDYISKSTSPQIVEARIRNHLSQKRQLDKLEIMSAVDALTGVPNRRRFDEYMDQEWRRGNRDQYSLALLMIDIDHFKKYNDTYGHQKGDECLRLVAHEIQQHLRRPSDMVARYGGEEFSIILPDTPLAAALALADRIRSGVEDLNLEHTGSEPFGHITISIGVATKVPKTDHSIVSFIEAADKNLYTSKDRGRNRITGGRAA